MSRQFVFERWSQILLVLAAMWVCFMVLVALPMMCTNPSKKEKTSMEPMGSRISEAFTQLNLLQKQNEELKSMFHDLHISDLTNERQADAVKMLDKSVKKALDSTNDIIQSMQTGKVANWRKDIDQKSDPDSQYELVRRKIKTNVQEFWNFIHSEVKKAYSLEKSENEELRKVLQNILDLGVENKRMLMHDMEVLHEVDGYERWREIEAADLSDLVQRRIHRLQNPTDCSTAKKLVCNLNKGCGLGCQLHHVVYCFILAYATERTLVLHSTGWRYHRGGWEQVFQPLSDSCTSVQGETHDAWPGKWFTQVLTVSVIDALSPRPPYLPLAIPADLSPRLNRIHGNPAAWWIGQFLKYMLKPQPETKQILDQATKKLNFHGPIVGVHVRRTDKVGTEAAFHRLEEYMIHVEEYFNSLELKGNVGKRRIYLASDDPKVIIEARDKYPRYDILGDTDVAKTASLITRYNDVSLHGIILDIHFLSLCDHLVCTFSSQVCRTAYEMMQYLHVDASDKFTSLDDIYYFGGQNAHNVVAVMDHEPKHPQEMQMRVGDKIGIAGNHWNGYSKGKNKRTNQLALFPSFKTVDHVNAVDLPTYTDVPIKV